MMRGAFYESFVYKVAEPTGNVKSVLKRLSPKESHTDIYSITLSLKHVKLLLLHASYLCRQCSEDIMVSCTVPVARQTTSRKLIFVCGRQNSTNKGTPHRCMGAPRHVRDDEATFLVPTNLIIAIFVFNTKFQLLSLPINSYSRF